ncbi:hypothetical protein OQA88_9992 [Cercophora sp. LCS_1]
MQPKSLLLALLSSPLLATALRSETRNEPEVYGWCDFTWANAHKVQNVQCGAKDRKCDAHSVYAMLEVYSDNGKEKEFARYNMGAGCDKTDWDDTKHSWDNLPRSNLAKARVKACVDIQGGSDKCYYGNWVDNPYESG